MDDYGDESPSQLRSKRFFSFDCPACSANTPMDDGFSDGDELRCSYCGLDFLMRVTEEGTIRLREI